MPASSTTPPPGPASSSVLPRNLKTITVSQMLLSSDDFILCNSTAASIVATLPLSSSMARKTMTFKKMDTTANTVTIQTQGGDLIDGGTTKMLTGATMPSVTLFSTGSTWYIQ